MTKPRNYDYGGTAESEFEFTGRLSASAFKHVSRVHRNERIRTSACREHESQKTGGHHGKNFRRFERF